DLVRVAERLEVRAPYRERTRWVLRVELPGGVDRVNDRETKATASLQDSRELAQRLSQPRDVVQGHEGDREVEPAAGEGKRDGVAERYGDLRSGRVSQSHQRGRAVDGDDVVAACLQIAGEATFSATQVERSAARRREQREELITVEAPVAVVHRRASP